jgi:hypothetical protein
VVLAATVNVTGPEPVPDAPLEIVIQPADSVVVQAQFDEVVTVVEAVPPAATTVWLVGDIAYEQAAAACVTVKVAPAIVSVPVRCVVAVLAATLKETVPLPVSLAPAVTVIQELLLTAVHAHVLPAVTVALPVPPAATTDWLVGDTDGAHVTGGVNANVLERVPPLLPPGPTACTSTSYVTPVSRGVGSKETKSNRIMPSDPGVGLPRLTVWSAVAPPARYTSSEYSVTTFTPLSTTL